MADKTGGPRGCPVCGKPAIAGHSPFCSERCRKVDLNRWLVGRYRVPTDEKPDPEHPQPSPSEED